MTVQDLLDLLAKVDPSEPLAIQSLDRFGYDGELCLDACLVRGTHSGLLELHGIPEAGDLHDLFPTRYYEWLKLTTSGIERVG